MFNLQITLPIELTNEIMSYLPDKLSLSSCCLVCKGWRRWPQGKLLRNIYIDNNHHTLRSFLDFVSDADALREQDRSEMPLLSDVIRSLRIRGQVVLLVDLRAIIQALPRIEELWLSGLALNGEQLDPAYCGGDHSPVTLNRLSIEDVTTTNTYDELLQLFSLLRWVESLRVANLRIDDTVINPTVDDSEPTLQPSYTHFPRNFEAFKRISLGNVSNLPYVLQLFAKVLQRRREREGEHGREITHVDVGDIFSSSAPVTPGSEAESFALFAGGFCGSVHVFLVEVPSTLDGVRLLNLPAFCSLTSITLRAPLALWPWVDAPEINSRTFATIATLIGQCPESLTRVILQLVLVGYMRADIEHIPPSLKNMGAEFSRLQAVRAQPKLSEFRWDWITYGWRKVERTVMEKVRKELDNIVREKLPDLEERGLLRFGQDGDLEEW